MASPYTAVNADILPEVVNTFLINIMTPGPELYSVTYVSSGAFGAVFSIDVDIRIENPFQTFITDQGNIIYTSDNRYLQSAPYMHRFCCKIVPINLDLEMLSFTNECNKQKDIYARTNNNLNAVCLPLFYHSIVSADSTGPLKHFIESISTKTGMVFPVSENFGISFMPFSANKLPDAAGGQPMTVESLLDSEFIRSSIDEIAIQLQKSNPVYGIEPNVIGLFHSNINIYSFVILISLVIRLYLAGYCHGDLHLRNIVAYYHKSGITSNPDEPVTTEGSFFPSFFLIDSGYAFKHGNAIPEDIGTLYEAFKRIILDIIQIISPKSRHNMITSGDHYNWFPKILMDGIGGPIVTEQTLNESRCSVIFNLFLFFEKYRTNLEGLQILSLNRLAPSSLVNIRAQNARITASVDAYIDEITGHSLEDKLYDYNANGGRHRNYYVSNRKQTKINKKHTRSMRRRKSQTRRRRRRHRSKSKHY